ncbi:MAG: EscJ/YscJ/HrcJ family type III secretion inner membrane ring protein [Parachlamydiales bacterium]
MPKRLVLLLFPLALLVGGCASKREVVSEVDERQANEIVVFLTSQHIQAEKMKQAQAGGAVGGQTATPMWSVVVPAGQENEALTVLARNGLPRPPGPNLVEAYKKTGLVSSASEEKVRYQELLAAKLASEIQRFDGVTEASVTISFPMEDEGLRPGGEAPPGTRVSVLVKHQGILDDPNAQLVSKIRRLVAGSIAGLDFNNVTVVADRSRFTDVMTPTPGELLPTDEKQFDWVWGMAIATDSVARFRVVFFSLTIGILVLAALLAWLLWKLYPAIYMGGGVSALFTSARPLQIEGAPPRKKKEEEEEEEE